MPTGHVEMKEMAILQDKVFKLLLELLEQMEHLQLLLQIFPKLLLPIILTNLLVQAQLV